MLDKIKQLITEIESFIATTPEEVEQFRIKHLSKKGSIAVLFDDFKNVPGAGAAGGMGFAFLSYLSGKLRSGIELVIETNRIEEKIKAADIVITGEGRLDSQSCMGKAPVGIAKIAKKYGKICIAFSGCLGKEAEKCNDFGIDAFFPILPTAMSLEEAMNTENAYKNLKNTAGQVFRLLRAIDK